MMRARQIAKNLVLCLALCVQIDAQQPTAGETDNVPELFRQGKALALADQLAAAEVPLTRAARLAPGDGQVLTLLGEIKSRLGEQEQAAELFRRVTVAQPGSSDAHLHLSIALADLQKHDEALLEVQKAIRLNPRNAKAHLNRARLLADAHRVAEARAEFVQTAHLAPGDVDTAYFQGVFEKDNGNAQAAVALLQRVLLARPDDVRLLLLLAQTQQQLGRQQEAIDLWEKAVALDPTLSEALYELAQALRQVRPEESAQRMQQFQQLHAANQNLERVRELGNQAYAAMQEQKWEAAVTTLQEAISLCSACSLAADLHQRLGLAECHRGNLDRGEHELRVALSLHPNDRETLQALQWVAEQRQGIPQPL